MSKRHLKYSKRQLTPSPLKDQQPFVFFWKQKRKLPFLKGKIVLLAVVVSFCLGASVSYFLQQQTAVTPSPPRALSIPIHHTQARFTPGQACLPLIQQALAIAQKSIHLQAYTFTQKKMTNSLIQATKRGVDVIILLDKSQYKAPFSQYRFLKAASIPVFFDTKPAIAHNKVIIIDGKIVITGSYNFSQAAETKNAENLLIIHSPKLASLYEANFQKRLKESIETPLPSPHNIKKSAT